MMAYIALVLAAIVLVTGLLSLLLHSHKQKRSPLRVPLLAARAIVDRELAPEGSVIVNGELWPARSKTESVIPADARVVVVGTSRHLLLVERQSP